MILNYFLKHARLATLGLTASEAVRILTLEQSVVNTVIVRCSFVTLWVDALKVRILKRGFLKQNTMHVIHDIFHYCCTWFLFTDALFFYLSLGWFFFRISSSVSAIARGFFLPKRKRSARWSFIFVEFSAILELFIFHYHEDSEKYICTNHSFRIGMASQSAYWKMSDNVNLCT